MESKTRIVLATTNPGKLKELQEMAGDASFIELALAPESFSAEETGKTFLENAIIKATSAAKLSDCLALADDSGIAVEALAGGPGVFSARYCNGSDGDRRAKLMGEMDGLPMQKRDAAFVCAMALADKNGNIIHTTEGIWRGKIALEARGNNGFGYDPIFYLSEFDKTAAELDSAHKNVLSHRGQAWLKMLDYLKTQMSVSAS